VTTVKAGAFCVAGAVILGSAVAVRAGEVLALVGLMVGVAVALVRPQAVQLLYVFVLASVPFATVPVRGLAVPLIAVLGVLALVGNARSAVVAPAGRVLLVRVGIGLALVLAALSALITGGDNGIGDVTEPLKWIGAVSGVLSLALVVGDAPGITRVVKVFLSGYILGAVIAGLTVLPATSAVIGDFLQSVGYLRTGADARYFVFNGQNIATRLTGSYTDPNILGLFSLIALGLSSLLARRWALSCAAVAFAMLLASLSRGAILGFAVSLILWLLLGKSRAPAVLSIFVVAGSMALAATVAPSLLLRLSVTGSSEDLGAQDRLRALSAFSDTVGGRFLFGLGWGRPEFRETAAAFKVNVIANAPLAAVYRAGILFAMVLVGIMLVGLACAISSRSRGSSRSVMIGATTAGVIVAIQTGYGGAVIPAVSAAWLLIVLVGAIACSSAAMSGQVGAGPSGAGKSPFSACATERTRVSSPGRDLGQGGGELSP
jgi:hypothetical protein